LCSVATNLTTAQSASAATYGSPVALGALPGTTSCYPSGLNNTGLIVGYCNSPDSVARPFLFDPTTRQMTELTGLSGATAVNDAGTVIGHGDSGINGAPAALDTVHHTISLITGLPGVNADLTAINNRGLIVGGTTNATDIGGAFAYDLSTHQVTELGTLPGETKATAMAVNDNGLIVGDSQPDHDASNSHAFVYDLRTHTMNAIGALPGDTQSQASAVNNAGLVVGQSIGSILGVRAFIYDTTSGTMTNLSQLFPNAINTIATGINDSGVVVGYQVIGSNTVGFAYDTTSHTATDLGPLPGDYGSTAQGVNNAGTVIGFSNPQSDPSTWHVLAYRLPLPPTARFVTAAYNDFLGRAPSWNETTWWSVALSNGASRYSLTLYLAATDEWVSHIVTGFYQNTLGRAPDQAGLKYWEQQIESGHLTVAQVAAQFYASTEYFAGFGIIPNWFNDLYRKILHRTPDTAGIAYWSYETELKGRATIAYAFYQSQESCRDRVTALYEQLLGRNPDPAGLTYWAGRLPAQGDVSLAALLASSSEYYARAQTRFPSS
jgi:uncharacterized membrane protein